MLTTRALQPEVMDDPALEQAQHVAALRGLARIHWLTGTARSLWNPVRTLIQSESLRELTIMDVGCSDGWLLRQIWKRAQATDCKVRLIGCDFSMRALELCEQACQRDGIPIELHGVDVLRQLLPGPADVVINSLFLHHFKEAEVVRILVQFKHAARKLVVVEDLIRSRLGYGMCLLGVRALTRSRVVHIDGPLSVRAAFTLVEMRQLLQQAAMTDADLRKTWPERFQIQWRPDGSESYARFE